MKLIFQQEALQRSISIVQKAVSVRTTLPILECILLDANFPNIRMMANDMELGIETVVEGTIEERGSIALDARAFSDMIRKLPNEQVTITTNENYVAEIVCGKARFNLAGQPGEDFAALPIIEEDTAVRISQLSLRDVIRQTIFSISASENNQMMTGELFEVKDGILKVVALDGHRIAIRNLALREESPDKKVVVPGKTLVEISKILEEDAEKMVNITVTNSHILSAFDNPRVVSRLIDGEYFRIEQMLSSDYETKVTINRKDFLDCIDRAAILVRERDKMPVILTITDAAMLLQINATIGSLDEDLEIEKTGKDITIGFNPRFLSDALRAISEETVDLYFVNPKAPLFIRDAEKNYVYLILPVNIR